MDFAKTLAFSEVMASLVIDSYYSLACHLDGHAQLV